MFYTELTLKLATYLVVLAEISSLILASPVLLSPLVLAGIVFAVSGVIIFTASVAAMKDNWRAGIAENGRIGIVTKGIYQFSRNPAFLGFDCVYLGFLMMFWNLPCFCAPCLQRECSTFKFYRKNIFFLKLLVVSTWNIQKGSAGIWEEKGIGREFPKTPRRFSSLCIEKALDKLDFPVILKAERVFFMSLYESDQIKRKLCSGQMDWMRHCTEPKQSA